MTITDETRALWQQREKEKNDELTSGKRIPLLDNQIAGIRNLLNKYLHARELYIEYDVRRSDYEPKRKELRDNMMELRARVVMVLRSFSDELDVFKEDKF